MGLGRGRYAQDGSVESMAGDCNMCSTRKVVRSQCKTEEVEPGKFMRKCQKTEEILRECVGKPTEVLQSNREYTEEEVTGQVVKGNLVMGSPEKGLFEFPGLRSDIEAIERQFMGGISRFFDPAEEMKNCLSEALGDLHGRGSSYSRSRRRDIPIEGHPRKEVASNPSELESGNVDLSGLVRDV